MAGGFMDRVMGWLGLEPEEPAAAADLSYSAAEAPPSGAARARRGRVVPLPSAAQPGAGGVATGLAAGGMQVVICHPRSLNDVQAIAAHLKAHRPVLVSLKEADRETGRRVVDFLSGCVYALDGVMRPIGDEILLCAPAEVEVKLEELKGP